MDISPFPSLVACPLGRVLVGPHLKAFESQLLYILVGYCSSSCLLSCWVSCLVSGGSCSFVIERLFLFPQYRTWVPCLPHRILYVDGLVLVKLREFLSVSVVVTALVVLSRLQPIPKILLISWWINFPRECRLENSAVK